MAGVLMMIPKILYLRNFASKVNGAIQFAGSRLGQSARP
ncbi:hypothetical protein C1A50_1269 [Paenibacillus polymyxa]|nr:hypothetical protein C1A50_1269 [Paenibacillus polymyxa]